MSSSPSSSLRIAFVTTVKNRTQHLRQTLPANLESNRDYGNAVFVIVNYSSTDDLLHYLVTAHKPAMKSGRVVVYSQYVAGQFEMAHAKNVAHRCGILEGADILVNLDADNYTGDRFASYIVDLFAVHGPESFLWSKVIPGMGKQFRGCSGRIAVTPTQFLNVGGYDERFEVYSPDDKNFNARLQRLGYKAVEIDRQYLRSIPHSDGVRFKEYPHARTMIEEYESELRDGHDDTVTNFGRIGCGIVFRNFDPNPIELAPVPTRIFGIGMHKTATNSLHKALTILGYQSAHWKSPQWARMIWSEMNSLGRSLTLERSYALCDLPITLLYKQLDSAYPGSKFILTVRDEAKWLASVRNHFDYSVNPWRASWDTDCFTHRIHQELYGRKDFDEQTFYRRYMSHNAGVVDYFRGRSSQLLVMNVDKGDGFPELCRFLGRPVPEGVNFPHEYATTNGGSHE